MAMVALASAAAVALLVVLVFVAPVRPLVRLAAAPSPGAAPLRVPRAAGPITIGGEVDDPGWRGPVATTGLFTSVDGHPVTDSTARIVWADGTLYLLLYAADSDIRATVTTPDAPLWPEDAFRLTFDQAGDDAAHVIYVSANGTVTDAIDRAGAMDTSWQSNARVSHDVDGTVNDPSDDDEEWVIEMAIPLAALGLRGVAGERLGFSIRRCDAPKGGARGCASWGEAPSARGELLLE